VSKSQKIKKIDDIGVKYSDTVRLIVEDDLTWESLDYSSQNAGLSTLYPISDGSSVSTANILVDNEGQANESWRTNVGLLDNNIIPVLKDSSPVQHTD
jgi:hypothetical protein